MRKLYIVFISLFVFSGCGVVDLQYESEAGKMPKYIQKVENQQCMYLVGPFNVTKKGTVEQLVKDTIKKANKDGLFGNKLVNVKIEEGGYDSPIFSKHCLYITGNLVYDKFLDDL